MSQSTATVNTNFKKKPRFGRFIRAITRVFHKTKKPRQTPGCARREDNINCSPPSITVSQESPIDAVATNTAHPIPTNSSTISIVTSEGSVSCDSSIDVRGPRRFGFFRFASNSRNSLSSKKSGAASDSAYETSSELDTEVEEIDYNNKQDKKLQYLRPPSRPKTTMSNLSSRDIEYSTIAKLFKAGVTKQQILGIIRLKMPDDLVNSHERYKEKVASDNGRSKSQVTHRMFHGTKTTGSCNPERFLKDRTSSFCVSGCGACGIAQHGNQTKHSHYSKRMWFASSSSVSIGYCNSINTRVMFVVSVVSTTTSSILIVDRDEATLPEYMIIFK